MKGSLRPRFARRTLLALGLALASCGVWCAGCKSNEPEPLWVRGAVGAGNDRLLMDVTALSLQKCGFPIGSGVDPGNLAVVSGWHISLAPFRGKGWRERCEVRYRKLGPRRYEASVRVRREKNDDILRPLDLTYAKWIPDQDDPERARSVMQHLRSLLGADFEVGEAR